MTTRDPGSAVAEALVVYLSSTLAAAARPPAQTGITVIRGWPEGDIAQICGAAEGAAPSLRCHLTDLVGTHPLASTTLAAALRDTLSTLHAPLSA